jgi:hypothetical protein
MTQQERDQLIAAIAAAVRQRATDTNLSDDEQRWVRMAIKKEAQSIALRQAIIEKSLTGLVWAAIVGMGAMFLQWATAHGYKP